MEPTWAVILVALIAAFGGSAVATWLRMGYERGAEKRAAKLKAADAFTSEAFAAQLAFRDVDRIERRGIDYLDLLTATKTADSAVDRLRVRRARVLLFFDPDSDAGRAADGATEKWDDARSALLNEDATKALEHHEEAKEHLKEFTRTARRDIYERWWQRRGRRIGLFKTQVRRWR